MMNKHLHLIILMVFLSLGLSGKAHIFLDPINGDDSKSGASPATAVRTLDHARDLSITEIGTHGTDENNWIILCDGPYTITTNITWDGTTGDPDWPIHIKRCYSDSKMYSGNIFNVTAGATFTLSNVVIDGTGYGNGIEPYEAGTLIFLDEGTTLNLNSGAILTRNFRNASGANGGGVESIAGAHVVMNGGTIDDCWVTGCGGGVYLNSDNAVDDNTTSTFTMESGTINNCEAKASASGGGVFLRGKWVKVSTDPVKYDYYFAKGYFYGGEIRNCKANVTGTDDEMTPLGRGAGLCFSMAIVDIDGEGMLIHHNKANRYGGGINIIDSSEVRLKRGEIYNNIAYNTTTSPVNDVFSGAAGVHVSGPATFTMTGGEIYNNTALNGCGGAIHASSDNGVVNLLGGKIHDNQAKYGGAINLQYGTLEFSASSTVEIYNNTAQSGGAVAIDGATLKVNGGSFYNNTANGTGVDDGEDVYGVAGALGVGGAFYVRADNRSASHHVLFEIHNSEIYNNTAAADGGAIYIRQGRKKTYAADGITVTSNYADSTTVILIEGGAIYGNTAGGNGGALCANKSKITLNGGEIYNNQAGASSNGGGIYFATNSDLIMGSGAMKVKDNTVNGVPNNIYLLQDKTIAISEDVDAGHPFNPTYVGIYTEDRTDPIPVFSGTNAQVVAIYNGMTSVPMTTNVVDDSQDFSPLNPGSGTILYFGTTSPWSPLQRTINAMPSKVGDVYQIGTVKDLTAFLWYVNNITDEYDLDPSHDVTYPGAKGKLTADIDMEGHYWVPIANYTGEFDGNGYVIKNLSMVPTNISSGRGLFGVNTSGTIKNVILRDCYFGSTTSATTNYMGGIVSQNDASGKVANNVVEGTFHASNSYCIMGGVAGSNSGIIHSCYAAPDMKGYQMGGLVGVNNLGSKLFNSFANAKFDYKGDSKYWGGLVGVNDRGRIENCYSRIQNTPSPSHDYFAWLVGSNLGNGVKYCYIPYGKAPYTRVPSGTAPLTGHGKYKDTSLPVLYNHSDNQVVLDGADNPYVPSGSNKQLLTTLNEWVKQNGASTYTYWLRPWQKDNSSKFINDDLPILRLPATNAVASSNGEVYLDYNQVNELLTAYNTGNDAVLFYGSEANMNSNYGSSATLYIDEKAVLKPATSKDAGDITAYVGITLDNSAGAGGANPSFGGTDNIDWHFFSSSLAGASIGLSYPVGGTSYGETPDPATFTSSSQYFSTSFNSHYSEWDLYTYCEPDYHWINLKRNSLSHWHEDYPSIQITYNNPTVFNPGQGFLVATAEECYLQAYGTLNSHTTSVPLQVELDYTPSVSWTGRQGLNLLGNPYQSYLDFDAFAMANTTLWQGGYEYASYIIMDEDAPHKGYVQYAYDQSENTFGANRYLHPHQGFMVMAGKKDLKAKFHDGMRNVTGSASFRDGGRINYPLVNLFATDDNGNRDMVTVELGRPDKGGALKAHSLHAGKGSLYCHYEDEDYGIVFTQPGLDQASIRFATDEDCAYTMTWNTQNGEFSYLHLIDNITGMDIDCLAKEEYQFTSKTTDYTSRFRLVFGYTSIDEPEVPEPVEGPSSFAYYADGEIRLVETCHGASLQIIDMLGRVIVSRDASNASAISTADMAPGVYVLRLTGKEGTKVQKMVIR